MWGVDKKKDELPAKATSTSQSVEWIDAVSGRHISTDPENLLAQRRLIWRSQYGWSYDVWPSDAANYASGAGPNAR